MSNRAQEVITDGWSAYPGATRDNYRHNGTSVAASGLQAHEVLPAVHRVFALVKRWLLGTMQGSVSPEHLQAYLDEWVFGCNRRHSRSRGLPLHTLLCQAVEGQPLRYKAMRKARRTRPAPPPPRGARPLPPQPGRWQPRTAVAPITDLHHKKLTGISKRRPPFCENSWEGSSTCSPTPQVR